MKSMLKVAVLCLGSLATISAAEAMPAMSQFAAPAAVSAGGAQVDKAVVVVTRRRVVRPRVVIGRPVVRRRPVARVIIR